MSNLDMDWVKSQLQAAKVRKPVGDATMKLIELIESLDLTPEFKNKAIDMFASLAKGHIVVKENKNETWVPVQAGFIKVTEQVRVKADAFDGELGTIHNGRRGVVVGVRYGDVIIKSNDGKEPILDGAHYPPAKLEKLVLT
jgi:hypothetical protein